MKPTKHESTVFNKGSSTKVKETLSTEEFSSDEQKRTRWKLPKDTERLGDNLSTKVPKIRNCGEWKLKVSVHEHQGPLGYLLIRNHDRKQGVNLNSIHLAPEGIPVDEEVVSPRKCHTPT